MKVIDLAPDNAWEGGGDGYIIKAGQGGLEYDWRPHVARADADGKPWGLYWVCDSRYSPEYHKATIKTAFPAGHFGVLGLWLDIEKPNINMTDAAYYKTRYAYYKPVESIWRGIQAYTGVYPGMYFGPGTWDLIMGGTPLILQQEFADKCDCWIAHYTALLVPDMRGKWVTWAMWQYQGEPDYSRINPDWWKRMVGAVPPPPPPPPTGGNMQYKVVWSNGASERPQPSTAGSAIKVLAVNTLVDVVQDLIPDANAPTDTTKLWVKLVDGNYVASDYGDGVARSVRMVKVGDVTPPPPPLVTGPVTVHVDLNDNGVHYAGDATLVKQ